MLCWFGTILHATAGEEATDATAATTGSRQFAERMLLLTDLVLDHHVEPPTRQEMILMGARAAYVFRTPLHLIGLGRKVSDLGTRQATIAFLEEVHTDLRDHQDFIESFESGLLSAVPGAARLVDQASLKTQREIAANRYVGIGISLAVGAGPPTLRSVIYGGPAWSSTLR